MTKYDFYTGEKIPIVKREGYQYLGKGKIGNIGKMKIDGKTAYFLKEKDSSISFRISPITFDKSKFKSISYKQEKGNYRIKPTYHIPKQKPKNKLVFNTKIKKGDGIFEHVNIKLGKNDDIFLHELSESNIIKDMQLKDNDKLKVTIEKR